MEKKRFFRTVVDSILREVHHTPEKTRKEASVEVGDLAELMIETNMTHVDVQLHDCNRVDMVLESFAGGPELEHYFDGKQGRIYSKLPQQKKRNFHLGISPTCRLHITVPSDLAKRWSIATTSGNIKVSKLDIPEMSLRALSGNVNIEALSSDNLFFRVSSGNVRLSHIQCKQTEVIASSGNINIQNLKSDSLFLKASSGNMRLEHIQAVKQATCKLSSGNIRGESIEAANWTVKLASGHAKIHDFCGHVTGRMSSGIVDFGVKGDSSLDFTSTSGNINIRFEETPDASFNLTAPPENISTNLVFDHVHKQGHRQSAVIGNGTHPVKLKTSTGRIKISA